MAFPCYRNYDAREGGSDHTLLPPPEFRFRNQDQMVSVRELHPRLRLFFVLVKLAAPNAFRQPAEHAIAELTYRFD